MKTTLRVCSLLLALLAGAACAGDAPPYTLKSAANPNSIRPNPGRDIAFSSKLPLNKRYGELTPEQKRVVRGPYEAMGDADEPPFPAAGLEAIYRPVAAMQNKLLAEGEVRMFVRVGADGRAKSIEVYQSPAPEVTKLLANLLMLVEYKPALCGGVACEMDFPVYVSLKTTRP
jgi:hypothetical protein